jgi:hypothetical protein
MLATGLVSFGAGVLVGSLINDNNNNWGCNWHGGNVMYNRNVYVSNTSVVPARYAGGYVRPGYAGVRPAYAPAPYARPAPYVRPAPYGRPAAYPRPAPYPEAAPHTRPAPYTRPASYPAGQRVAYNPGNPATRPYNATNARQFAYNGSNYKPPNFPKPSELSGSSIRNRPVNRPTPLAGQTLNNRVYNPRNNPQSGYRQPNQPNLSARNNAFGGYQPGRLAQNNSDRGRASMTSRPSQQFQPPARMGGFRAGGGFHRR